MAYMQRVRLTKDSDLDDDTTWRYKLPSVGKYTAFEMVVESKREDTRTLNTVVHTLENCISKIELLAGGARALLSLTGTQLDAMNYWDFGTPNARRYRQEDATENRNSFFLLGGRGLYDTRYGWDMQKLGETYLEYTYDLQEGVADYFEADLHDVSLYGYRWMGSGEPNFVGHFRARQLAAWTTVASAIKTIEIPVGRFVRRICVQSKTRARTLGSCFSELEVSCNNGEFSPVIVKNMMDWLHNERTEYDLHNVIGGVDYGLLGTIMDLPSYWSYPQSGSVEPYGIADASSQMYGMMSLPARFYGDLTVNTEVVFTLSGYGFQKCLRIGFDHEDDGLDLLDARNLGSLDLICTAANADREVAAFVQDIINY